MSGVRFDADAIRELAKILRETDLTEIELVEKDSRIRVARQVTVQVLDRAGGRSLGMRVLLVGK